MRQHETVQMQVVNAVPGRHMEAKFVLPVGLNARQQLATYSDHVLHCNNKQYPESIFSTLFKHFKPSVKSIAGT
jgi:hypothetical protein